FKKEMREVEPPPQAPEQAQAVDAQVVSGGPQPVPPQQPSGQPTPQPAATAAQAAPAAPPPVPPQMGPAATPGTTAYAVAQQAWKPVTPPPVAPPPSPAGTPDAGTPGAAPAAPAQPSGFKAVVNKPAVDRVMAQQAALKAKQQPAQQSEANVPTLDRQALEAAGMQPPPAAPAGKAPNPKDLEKLGSGIGDALRTFREAANDVRRAIEPSMHTIKALVEALRDPDAGVRRTAAWALGMIGEDAVGPDRSPLASLLFDPDPGVREAAAMALGLTGDTQAGIELLLERLQEPATPADA